MGEYSLPKKYFVRWLTKKKDENKIKIDFHHYEKNRKVSDFITDEDVDNWDKDRPVFISAQTGAGKTRFVIERLIARIADSNREKAKKGKDPKNILIISNRIALNRQLKKAVAEAIVDMTGNIGPLRDMLRTLTPEGWDEKTDFGPVDIYSYQGLSSAVFEKKQYKYVVCDECHFFTSDSSFNVNTYSILETITSNADNAVRIYISATPEVAFEAIIRAEYERIHGNKYINKFLNANAKQKKNKQPLEVIYYDMKRNYDKFDIIVKNNGNDLYNKIKAEKGQWLIFVSSKTYGDKLKDTLNSASNDTKTIIDAGNNTEEEVVQAQSEDGKETKEAKKTSPPAAVLISADNKSKKNTGQKREFDNIVENGEFSCRFLITTSVLDNGVSIVADGIKGVIIDSIFDRIEVLQMVGRLRIGDTTDKIKVYIILPDIETEYKNTYTKLLATLSCDLIPPQGKATYDLMTAKLSRYANYIRDNTSPQKIIHMNPESGYPEYNICSVYNLVDRLSFLKRFVNKDYEPPYPIRGLRKELRDYYMDKGKDKSWSRNVIDLFETEDERNKRSAEKGKAIASNQLQHNENPFFYTYELNKTYYNYIYLVLLQVHYYKLIITTINAPLTQKQKDSLRNILNYKGKLDIPVDKEFMDIVARFMNDNQVPLDMEKENQYFDEMQKYKKLGRNQHYSSAREEIYRWFELPVPPPEEPVVEDKLTADQKITEDDFKKHVLEKIYEMDKDTIIDQETGKEVPFDKDYIMKYGLRKVSKDPESEYSKFFAVFGAFKKGAAVQFKGKEYLVVSYDVTLRENRTFYFFVPKT